MVLATIAFLSHVTGGAPYCASATHLPICTASHALQLKEWGSSIVMYNIIGSLISCFKALDGIQIMMSISSGNL